MNLRIVLILSLSHLIIDLTGSALPAMMPFLKEALQLSFTAVGTVIMISNLTSSIIQPCFGYLSDKIEIKWLLPVSVILTFVGFSTIGLASSFVFLLVVVVINGMGVAAYHPEGMKIMHYFTGAKKATGMSFFQVGGSLGLALGPLLVIYAIQLAGLSGTLLFLILGLPIFGLILLFSHKFSLPLETQKEGAQVNVKKKGFPSVEGDSGWGSMSLLIFAVAMRSWVHAGLMTFVPFYYIHVLNGDAFTAGRLVFIFLMGGVVGTMIGGIIADRIGHKTYFSLSMILSVPLLFLFFYVTGFWLSLTLFLIGLVLISSFPVTIVMGQTILRNRLGMASGLMMGFVIGVGGIGAGLFGIVADSWGVLTVIKIISLMPIIGFFPILLVRYPLKGQN